jgi:hypothetical protein
MTRRYLLFALAVAATAQVAPPRAGYIVDRSGSLRPVYGVAGAFTLGPPILTEVIAAAYSGKSLVVKLDRELLIDDKRFEAPAGDAVVTFDSRGRASEIYFPEADLVWSRREEKFDESVAARKQMSTWIQDGELFIDGVPVRLPSKPDRLSQMGENWLVVYGPDRTYAIRDGKVLELPEDAE